MDKITKPNDIFVATLQAPDATTLDLLQNNINASNTSLLTPEEYKKTPMVKKAFTDKNGVFNEEVFNNAYYQAYEKYASLSDEKAYEDVVKDLEYSSTDRFRPINSKVKDNSAVYTKLRNPQQQAYGIEGVGIISEASKTKEELAQSNRIYDPETGQFIDETPESLSLYKKALGDTLIYAKYEEDGYHIDPVTGQQVKHYKGEWKTDDEGNYYTEYLGARDLKDNQVVNLQDVLTDEDSMWNKLDFYDSDGKDKSLWGVAAKLVSQVAPYFIPVVGQYYAAFTTITGLASVLPTFYKSAEALIMGDQDTVTRDVATRMENWFRKWEPSKSEEGRNSFMSLENIASMVGDTVGQLFNQSTAAKASKYFAKKLPKVDSFESLAEHGKAIEYNNKLSSAFSLGYMGLTSAAGVYNDAISAGYDNRTAGIASLLSAGALFSIMQFNSTANNMGTWFLNKTTGYDPDISSGTMRKIAKDYYKKFYDGLQKLESGDKQPLAQTLRSFKRTAHNALDDLFNVRASGLVHNSLLEGFEEVTEEAVQDAVKGLVDTASYFGWTSKEGSFGGWDNVFSKKGMERYLETFVGGTLGGAVFEGARKLDNKIKKLPPEVEKDIYDIIKSGKIDKFKKELKSVSKFFPSELSTDIIEVNGKLTYAPATNGNSQRDIIQNAVLQEVSTLENLILRESENNKYDKNDETHQWLIESYARGLKNSDLEKIITDDWKDVNKRLFDAKRTLADLKKDPENIKDPEAAKEVIKKAEEQVENIETEIREWNSGKKFLEYNAMGFLMSENVIANSLSMDIRSFAKNVYGIEDYDNLNDSSKKEEIKQAHEIHNMKLAANNKAQWKDAVRGKFKALLKISPEITKTVLDFAKNKDMESFLLFTADNIKGLHPGFTNEKFDLKEFLAANPKAMHLNGRLKYDLASILFKQGIINADHLLDKEKLSKREGITEKEDPIDSLKSIINNIAAHSNVVVWDSANIKALITAVEEYINNTDNGSKNVNVDLKILKDYTIPGNVDLKLDLSKVDVTGENLTMQVTFKSILDAVKDMDIIDQRVKDLVDFIYGYEKTQLQLKVLRELLASRFEVLKDDFYISGFINPETYEYSETQKDGYILFSDLVPIGTTLSSFINPDIINGINSVEEGQKYINLLNAIAEATKDQDDIAPYTEALRVDPEQYAITPPELEQDYIEFSKKVVKESPLVELIYNIMHKTGSNVDKSLVHFLVEKSRDVRNGTIDLSKMADKQIIEDFKDTLQYIQMVARLAGENMPGIRDAEGNSSNPTAGLNTLLGRFTELYGNMDSNVKKDIRAMFPVLEKKDIKYLADECQNILSQVEFLNDAYNAYAKIDLAKDMKRRQVLEEVVADRLKNMKITFGNMDYSLPELPEEVTGEPYIFAVLEHLSNFIEDNNISKEDFINGLKNALPEAGKKTLPGYYSKAISIEQKTVSDDLLMEIILVNTAVKPSKLLELYINGTKDKAINPLLDQELSAKYAIASLINPEWFGSTMTYLSGSAGSGKTTITSNVTDALQYFTTKDGKNYNITATATSDKKAEELATGLGQEKGHNIFSFIENSPWVNNQGDDVKKELESSVKKLVDDGKPHGEVKGSIKWGDTSLEYTITKKDRIIRDISFTEESLKQIKDILQNGTYKHLKDSIIVIDEATFLDPLYVQLLRTLSSLEDFNTRILLLGDPKQIGFTLNIGNGIQAPFNLNMFSFNQPHRLNGIFRAQNTAVRENVLAFDTLAEDIIKYDYGEQYKDADGERIIKEFSVNTKLKYNNLKGHEITQDISRIETFKTQVPKDADILIIYENEEDLNDIEILFPKSEFPNVRIRSIRNFQGAEADYVLAYNFSATPTPEKQDYKNTDVDIKKMYTLISRVKKYGLIYDKAGTGLFSKYNIGSVKDPTVEDTVSSRSIDIWKRNLAERINDLDKQLQWINAEFPPRESKKKGDIDKQVVEYVSTQDSGDNLNDDDEPETEKNKRLSDIETIFGKDTALAYTSYVRLGISRDTVYKLEKLLNDSTKLKEFFDLFNLAIEKDTWSETDFFNNSGVIYGIPKNEENKEIYLSIYRLAKSDTDFGAFLKEYGENDYIKNADSFSELTSRYRGFLNSLLYLPKDDDEYYIDIKERDTGDDWCYKPNNDSSKQYGDTIATMMVTPKDNNPHSTYRYTIALLGSAREDQNKLFSERLHKLRTASKDNGRITKKLEGDIEEQRKAYYRLRQKLGDNEAPNIPPFVPYLVPSTGIRNFAIKRTIENSILESGSENDAINNVRKTKISNLEKFGFTYSTAAIDSQDALDAAMKGCLFAPEEVPDFKNPLTHVKDNLYIRIVPNFFGREPGELDHRFTRIYAPKVVTSETVLSYISKLKIKLGSKQYYKNKALREVLGFLAMTNNKENPKYYLDEKQSGEQEQDYIKRNEDQIQKIVDDFLKVCGYDAGTIKIKVSKSKKKGDFYINFEFTNDSLNKILGDGSENYCYTSASASQASDSVLESYFENSTAYFPIGKLLPDWEKSDSGTIQNDSENDSEYKQSIDNIIRVLNTPYNNSDFISSTDYLKLLNATKNEFQKTYQKYDSESSYNNYLSKIDDKIKEVTGSINQIQTYDKQLFQNKQTEKDFLIQSISNHSSSNDSSKLKEDINSLQDILEELDTIKSDVNGLNGFKAELSDLIDNINKHIQQIQDNYTKKIQNARKSLDTIISHYGSKKSTILDDIQKNNTKKLKIHLKRINGDIVKVENILSQNGLSDTRGILETLNTLKQRVEKVLEPEIIEPIKPVSDEDNQKSTNIIPSIKVSGLENQEGRIEDGSNTNKGNLGLTLIKPGKREYNAITLEEFKKRSAQLGTSSQQNNC